MPYLHMAVVVVAFVVVVGGAALSRDRCRQAPGGVAGGPGVPGRGGALPARLHHDGRGDLDGAGGALVCLGGEPGGGVRRRPGPLGGDGAPLGLGGADLPGGHGPRHRHSQIDNID